MPAPRMSNSQSQRAREERNLEDSSEDEPMAEGGQARALDPNQRQSADAKRKVRAKYRQMQEEADVLRDSVATLPIHKFQAVVARTNDLFSNVYSAGEATLDSRLLNTHTETAARLADLMKTSANAFDLDEFLIKAKAKLGLNAVDEDGEDENVRRRRNGNIGEWDSIGWLAARFSRRTTGVEFLNGPLSVGYKKRVVAKRARVVPAAPLVQPIEVSVSTKDEESETVANGKILHSILRKLAKESPNPAEFSINLFKFVVNPNSYSQTVENLFFLSFLVRDSHVMVEWSEDEGVHVIRLPGPNDGDPHTIGKRQEVFSLTMDVVEDAKDLFNITHSIIPDRPGLAPPAGNGWLLE